LQQRQRETILDRFIVTAMPLKLIVRTSDHSFPLLKGQLLTPEQKLNTPIALHDQRVFSNVQILCNDSNDHNVAGCCRYNAKKRILWLREMNFLSIVDLWELYSTSNRFWSATQEHDGLTCLHLVLIPTAISNKAQCRDWNAWTFLGICRASVLTLDLEAMVAKHLKSSVQLKTTPTFHWHVDVFMESIVDETQTCASQALWEACGPTLGALKVAGRGNLPLFIDRSGGIPRIAACKERPILSPNGDRDADSTKTASTKTMSALSDSTEDNTNPGGIAKLVQKIILEANHPTSSPFKLAHPSVSYASITRVKDARDTVGESVLTNRTNSPPRYQYMSPSKKESA
jgi:hypothetical protein